MTPWQILLIGFLQKRSSLKRERVIAGGPRLVVETANCHLYLLSIGDWIAERAGMEVAQSYMARVEAYCSRLEFAGERGRRYDDLRPGMRVVGFERRIAVTFISSDDEIRILRVYYGGQNWQRPS